MQDDDFALAEKFVGHPDVIRGLANEFKRIRAEVRALSHEAIRAAVEAEREVWEALVKECYCNGDMRIRRREDNG